MKTLKQLVVFFYKTSKTAVNLMGIIFLIFLVLYSIVYTKGYPIESPSIPLDKLITPDFVYWWIIIFIVFILGFFVDTFVSLRKAIVKKNEGTTNSNIISKLLQWFISD